MDDDLRQKIQTAASSLQDQDDEERVPLLVRKVASFVTVVIVALFTLFGMLAGVYYSGQGPQPGENAPLLSGIGLFLGLMIGAFTGVNVRKLIYKIFSR